MYWLFDPFFLIFAIALAWFLFGQIRGRYLRPFAWIGQRRRLSALQKEIQARPHDLTLRLDHGKLAVAHKKWGDAIESLTEVVERRENSPEAWYYLGLAQLGAKKPEAGVESIRKALELRPDLLYGDPQLRIGDHYVKTKQWSLARDAFEAAVHNNASSSEGFYKLGLACKELGDRDAAKRAMAEAVAAHEHVPKYKRRENRPWKWRAKLARV